VVRFGSVCGGMSRHLLSCVVPGSCGDWPAVVVARTDVALVCRPAGRAWGWACRRTDDDHRPATGCTAHPLADRGPVGRAPRREPKSGFPWPSTRAPPARARPTIPGRDRRERRAPRAPGPRTIAAAVPLDRRSWSGEPGAGWRRKSRILQDATRVPIPWYGRSWSRAGTVSPAATRRLPARHGGRRVLPCPKWAIRVPGRRARRPPERAARPPGRRRDRAPHHPRGVR
jgi:hypothetical protein